MMMSPANDPGPLCRETRSAEETRAFGEMLGAALTGGLVIAIEGRLGSGKTQLAKGIARGNGLKDTRSVTSPTFSLVHQYPGRILLFHIDAYRLAGSAELEALGFHELVRDDSAVVIEWADRVQGALPPDRLSIAIVPTGTDSRTISVTGRGATALAALSSIAERAASPPDVPPH